MRQTRDRIVVGFLLIMLSSSMVKSQNISDSLIYGFINEVLIDFKADNINRLAHGDFLKIYKGGLRFEFSNLNKWVFYKQFQDSKIEDLVAKIDSAYLLMQANKRKKFKWDKEKIGNNVIVTKPAKRCLGFWIKKEYKNIHTHHTFSVPIFDKSKEFAFIFYSTYSDPLAGSGSILLFYKLNGKWTNIADYHLYIL